MNFEIQQVVDRVMKEATTDSNAFNFDLEKCIAKHATQLFAMPDGMDRVAYVTEIVNNKVDQYLQGNLPTGAEGHYEFKVAKPPKINKSANLDSFAFSKSPNELMPKEANLELASESLTKLAALFTDAEKPKKGPLPYTSNLSLLKTAQQDLTRLDSELGEIEWDLIKQAESSVDAVSEMLGDLMKSGYKIDDLWKAAKQSASKENLPRIKNAFALASDTALDKIEKAGGLNIPKNMQKHAGIVADWNHPFFTNLRKVGELCDEVERVNEARKELEDQQKQCHTWLLEEVAGA